MTYAYRRLPVHLVMLACIATLLTRPEPANAQGIDPFADRVILTIVDDSVSAPPTALLKGDIDGKMNTIWIIRFRDGRQRNVVALRRSTASSGLLLFAIRRLQEDQAIHGKTPERITVLGAAAARSDASDEATRALFAALTTATRSRVRAIGNMPALAIRLVSSQDTR